MHPSQTIAFPGTRHQQTNQNATHSLDLQKREVKQTCVEAGFWLSSELALDFSSKLEQE